MNEWKKVWTGRERVREGGMEREKEGRTDGWRDGWRRREMERHG